MTDLEQNRAPLPPFIEIEVGADGRWASTAVKTVGKTRKPKAVQIRVLFEDDSELLWESPFAQAEFRDAYLRREAERRERGEFF